jgi:hypothetical protein
MPGLRRMLIFGPPHACKFQSRFDGFPFRLTLDLAEVVFARPSIFYDGSARLDRHADETEGSVVGARRLIIVVRLALLLSLAGRVDRQALLPVDQ